MYYGEGAGNRRKLIRATVKERSKDSRYKAEFDKALAKQDMAKHASAAKRERKTTDRIIMNKASQTVSSLMNEIGGRARSEQILDETFRNARRR